MSGPMSESVLVRFVIETPSAHPLSGGLSQRVGGRCRRGEVCHGVHPPSGGLSQRVGGRCRRGEVCHGVHPPSGGLSHVRVRQTSPARIYPPGRCDRPPLRGPIPRQTSPARIYPPGRCDRPPLRGLTHRVAATDLTCADPVPRPPQDLAHMTAHHHLHPQEDGQTPTGVRPPTRSKAEYGRRSYLESPSSDSPDAAPASSSSLAASTAGTPVAALL